jgi:poly(hydroxyalkanoate) granule-associated protein
MATKKKARKKTTTKKGDLTESVHRIWLAGLGAFATAEEEGGKLFQSLIARGKKYERTIKKPVDQAAANLTDTVKGTVKDVRGRAGKTMKKIEKTFDEQVDAALHRVGVPTRKEIAALSRKVDRLTRSLEGKPARTTRKKSARKTAKKKAS